MTNKIRIYTKTGDKGETSLFGGTRVKKTDHRVETYGTVDELNALLGLVCSQHINKHTKALLETIQDKLFNIGAELANPNKVGEVLTLEEKEVTWLERCIDEVDKTLPVLRNFILPGGTFTASLLHYARTVCRRAERQVIRLSDNSEVNPNIIKYLNRLSDLLFVLGRAQNQGKKQEKIWRKY